MSTSTSKAGGVADLLSGEAADAERARLADIEPALDDAAASAAMADDPPAKPAAPAVATRSRKATRKPKASATKKAAPKKTAAKKAVVAKPAAAGTERARDVAVQILKRRGGEMPVKDLADAVVKSGRTKLGGKTPAATVAAQIYVSAKKGELFKVVSRGVVARLES